MPKHNTYLLFLPGIGGWTPWDEAFVRSLGNEGVAHHVEYYDWLKPNWLVGAQVAYEHNRLEAKKISGAIAEKMKAEPDAKIILTAWSAGGCITVWALEDLPEGVQVQSVLMIQPAVAPTHDLTRALSHVRGHMYYTNNPFDLTVLYLGTTIFGTADDGVHTAAAGQARFIRPDAASAQSYKKLVALDLSISNGFPTHSSGIDPEYARKTLAPLLIHDAAAP